jgi:hypothetical protein
MNSRSTLVLVIVAFALGGYYLWIERELPSVEQSAGSRQRLVPDWDSAEVLRLDIEHPSAATATARVSVVREGADAPWRVVEPIRTSADQQAVRGLLSALRYAEREDELSTYDPAELGLAPPRLRVVAVRIDGRRVALSFGRDDSTGRLVHVEMEGREGCARVTRYLLDRLDTDVADLREKRLFTMDRWKVERVIVKADDQELRLFKRGDHWRLEAPVEDWAENERAERLLAAVHELEAEAFVDDDEDTDLDRYGLLRPALTVTLEGGGLQETVLLGAPEPGAGTRNARRADHPPVVVVKDSVSAQMDWAAEPWRSRQLLHLDRAPTQRIVVTGPDGAIRARIDRGEAGFVFTVPTEPPVSADAERTLALLDGLEALRIDRVITRAPEALENFGLDAPLVVDIEQKGVRHRLRIGKRAPRDNAWYVARGGREEVLQVVIPQTETLRHLWPTLRERRLVDLVPEDVVRLVLTRPGEDASVFVRLPDGSFSTPVGRPDPRALRRLVASITGLTAERVLPRPSDLAEFGLEAPWLVVRGELGSGDGAGATHQVIEVALGTVDRSGAYRARLRVGPPTEDGGSVGATWWLTLPRDAVDTLDAVLLLPPDDARASGAAVTRTATPEAATGTATPDSGAGPVGEGEAEQ